MSILPNPSLLNQIKRFIQGEKFSLNYGLFLLSWKSGLRVSEAVSFDYQLKHPRHKDLYSVKGKGNKKRYVYISSTVINELKTNHWKPNQTNRINFYHFLQKTKKALGINQNIELTPHTLRRCFTTHNALNGVPMPVLQKALGHKNIKTTSGYWKGSVDIREFGGWLEPNSDPKEPEEIPEVKVNYNPQLPKSPQIPVKLENPDQNNTQEPELLKTIEKLKGELAEKDNQLKSRDGEISLLTGENQKLKAINQEKDRQLLSFAETLNKVELEKGKETKELQERLKNLGSDFNKSRQKVKQLETKNKSLIENYTNLKNIAKNLTKIKQKPEKEFFPKNDNFLLNNLSEMEKPQNNSLTTKERNQAELLAQIQVWKPPN